MRRFGTICALLFVALLPAAPAVRAADNTAGFCSRDSLTLHEGEVNTGDLYFAGKHVDIAGRHEGDLIAVGQSVIVSGVVTGDVAFFGQSLDVSGRVEDSVRTWAYAVTITGTIEGDLVAAGLQVSIHPRAHITGNVYLFGSMATVDGTIDGSLHGVVGKFDLAGQVGRDVDIKADALEIADGARVGGDLTYETRKPLEDDLSSVVAGAVTYKEKKKKEKDEGPWITTSSVIWWTWFTVSALVVGYVLLAVFPGALRATADPIRDEPVTGTLIGFGAALIVPAAGVIALILLPLGLLTLLLFAVAVYLAKLPVALWLGRRLFRGGAAAPSPYVALTVGVVLLRLLYQIPYLGIALWGLSVCLGLGSTILAVRRRANGTVPAPASAGADG